MEVQCQDRISSRHSLILYFKSLLDIELHIETHTPSEIGLSEQGKEGEEGVDEL